MLNPTMRSGWPRKRLDTLLITPGVSILEGGSEGGSEEGREEGRAEREGGR